MQGRQNKHKKGYVPTCKEDRTAVLAHLPCVKVQQTHFAVHRFIQVLSFSIFLWCLSWEVSGWPLAGSWVPAQESDTGAQEWGGTAAMAASQGARLRGLASQRAACASWLRLLQSQMALTWDRSRGCPGLCPPLGGPTNSELRAEAWYMSGCCHQSGSHHRKPFWRLPRSPWCLQVQILPETTSSRSCQHCLRQRCWGLLAPRWCWGNGTGYPFISFSTALT